MLRGASRLRLPSAASLSRPPPLSLALTRRPGPYPRWSRSSVSDAPKPAAESQTNEARFNAQKDLLNPSTGVVSLHALRSLGIQNGTNLIPSSAKLAAANPTAPSLPLSFPQKCKAYMQLTKPELSGLVAITSSATAALCMAPSINATWAGVGSLLVSSSLPLVFWSGVGTFLCAGGANAFNQAWEAEYDKVMNRTKHRPVPSGRLTRKSAVVAGSLFSLAGVSSLAYFTNPLTAGIGALNIALYLTYTWMKRKTEWNTLFGGIVGALPPIMGAAAAGSLMHPAGWVMASVLFFWQFPHFMAIAKIFREDYKRAGFRMVQDPKKMGIISLASCAALMLISLVSYPLHLAHYHFFYISTLLNAWYTWSSYKFYENPTPNARPLLRHSVVIQMLLCIMVMLAVNLTNEKGEKYCLYDIAVANNTVSATTTTPAPASPSQ